MELGSLQIRCDVQCQRSGGEVDQNWPSTASSSPGIRETDTEINLTQGVRTAVAVWTAGQS